MRVQDRGTDLRTSQPLTTILRGPLVTESALENGFTLLICGLPGAGKTTLGLFLLNSIYEQHFSNRTHDETPGALLLSLVESSQQLETVSEAYGLRFRGRKLPAIRIRLKAGDIPDLAKLAADAEHPLRPGDLLFVDGISVLGTEKQDRESLEAFLDQVKKARLFAILVAEEYSRQGDIFLEYAVDGIIRLGVDSVPAHTHGFPARRWLEVNKLRWHDYALGRHAFRLQGRGGYPDDPGVVFFPSATALTHLRHARAHGAPNAGQGTSEVGLRSGVPGFDGMIPHEGGPFGVGEQVLLLGPAGSGKFEFGTQFLAAAAPGERAICVSFLRSVDKLRDRLRHLSRHDDLPCECLYLNPAEMVIEEMFGALYNVLAERQGVTRLFLHGLSMLRYRFTDDAQYESLLRSVMNVIATYPTVTTLVSYHTPRVFASYAEVDIPANDLFSTVIGFNFQEQYNRVKPGIVILKSRASRHDSALRVPKIVDGLYTVDPKAGWARIGLLSGEREQVHEERPFVKLFFENRSEAEVLERPFVDFKGRYPGDQDYVFLMVGKHNPQPSHWSFQGYAGPGHSNTKLVQLRKYVMDVLRDEGLLLEVPDEVKKSLEKSEADRFEDGTYLWRDCARRETDPHVMIPAFADVGLLVYHADAIEGHPPRTWDDLLALAKTFSSRSRGAKRHLFTIPNTVGDYRNFISFFFELCWTFGWDFPKQGACATNSEAHEALVELFDGPFAARALELMRELVAVPSQDASTIPVPNPNRGGHYHESVFSRRWFSKIHLLPDDARARATDGLSAFQFGIAPLPGADERRPGISNVDLYALGVIREALAPETAWMLASSLFEHDVETARAKRKRGLSISRSRFDTSLVQSNLNAPPPAPSDDPKHKDFFKNAEGVFSLYTITLNAILKGDREHPQRFRRTSDIPKFFWVEELLAANLPRMFDDAPRTIDRIRDDVREGLRKIYAAGAADERVTA